VFSLDPAAVEAAAPALYELYGRRSAAAGSKGGGPSPSSCALVVAAAFAAARACSCPSVVHLPRAESLFVSDAGGGGRSARLGGAGCRLPPAASLLPAVLREASRLRARERLALVGESSRPHEAAGRRDARAMALFFAGGLVPVGPPSGSEERRAVVAAVAAASGARLEGGAAEGAGPGGPARSSSSSSSAAAAELDALFLTAEGWVAGDLARAVRGALEARMRRRRGGREGEKGGGGGGGSGGSGGSGGGNGGQGGEAPPPPPPSPPPSPSAPPPLRGPLTAREIVTSLLSGPRPPRASELAAVLDWARAAVAWAGGEEEAEGKGTATRGGNDRSKTKGASSAAAARRDNGNA